MDYNIKNTDCIEGASSIMDDSVFLGIYDPPFGIQEATFNKHYKRDKEFEVDGYVEAPDDYYNFTFQWMEQAKRILKQDGSMYIISGWSNSDIIGSVIRKLNLHIINKIIWKFNFGVFTKKKYVTSHYEIFYVSKDKKVKTIFNTFCRYGSQQKSEKGESLLYQDMQSVWDINKEYHPGKIKNKNKLPEELIKKMILYSSNEGDIVCDFFLGNFTTAIVAKKLGRIPIGFELNKSAFNMGIETLKNIKIEDIEEVQNITPPNQGKKIDEKTISAICDYFKQNHKLKTKKDIIQYLMEKYGRGRFSIKNIIDSYCYDCINDTNDNFNIFE